MRIMIDKIIHVDSNLEVEFSSDFGSAKAYWNGPHPRIHHEYQVEIDINDTLSWDRDVAYRENDKYCIRQINSLTYLSGCIDSIDNDGYTILRMGDSIIPFLTIGIPLQVGTYITITTQSISLSPVNY